MQAHQRCAPLGHKGVNGGASKTNFLIRIKEGISKETKK
jgi:hypothetical protein